MASRNKKKKGSTGQNQPVDKTDHILSEKYVEFVDSGGAILIPSPTDIYESNDYIYADIELPGVEEKNIIVTIEKDKLVIEGHKEDSSNLRKCNYHCAERGFGNFKRSILLGDVVDSENVQAKYENGILHITIPKRKERRKTVHKIKVSSNE